MTTLDNTRKRLFVLDSNVLIHDPTCLYRFQEHDVFLPMMVLEELDNNKRGHSDVARSARQASRFLEEHVRDATRHEIETGLSLPQPVDAIYTSGKLYIQTQEFNFQLPDSLPGSKADNTILSTAMALQQHGGPREVILVSKDINLRIKAAALGIKAEDYHSDQVLDDVSLLYSGSQRLETDFWDTHSKALDSWVEEGRTFYRVSGADIQHWHPCQFIYSETDNFEAIVRTVENKTAIIELLDDYRSASHMVWGINARNLEQNFALHALMDPSIDFVTLVGAAGTGKTLLTLAAALSQTLDKPRYQETIMTRVTVPVGEDIGFLPGTEEEKMTPWMGALMDNLEVLVKTEGGNWERQATTDLLSKRIKIRSLNFMRGRTFLNKFLIIDEAQNLTPKQMKTLITRAGPGTKVVCLGNVSQIDTPYLTETTSGLTYVVDRFKTWAHSAHIILQRGERSRLAEFASEAL
jgi:PhoH-like ATPase